jgi:hypothetical protein
MSIIGWFKKPNKVDLENLKQNLEKLDTDLRTAGNMYRESINITAIEAIGFNNVFN